MLVVIGEEQEGCRMFMRKTKLKGMQIQLTAWKQVATLKEVEIK